jgi:hypothetical protein
VLTVAVRGCLERPRMSQSESRRDGHRSASDPCRSDFILRAVDSGGPLGAAMSDKSPRQAKKPGKSIKEKRAIKKQKKATGSDSVSPFNK